MTSLNEEKDWYEHRHELEVGDVFTTYEGRLIELDRRVPGDGTNWYVASCYNGKWFYDDDTIHPSDLKTKVMKHYG